MNLTANLIAGSDLLIDLRTAGSFGDMPLLCGYYSRGPLADRAGAAAAAFAARFTWQHPIATSGRSLSAAQALGIPSIYVESAGSGRTRQTDVDAYLDGLLRVLVHYRMIDTAPAAPPSIAVVGEGDTDFGISSQWDGYFVASADAGDLVETEEVLGSILGEDGQTLEEVRTVHGGYVMMLRMSSLVAASDALALIGAPL